MEELGKETLLKLIEWIETASPQLWAIAQRQVQIEIIVFSVLLAIGVLTLALAVVLIFHDDDGFFSFMGFITGIGLAALGGLMLMARLMNPDYYAIRVLVGLLTGS